MGDLESKCRELAASKNMVIRKFPNGTIIVHYTVTVTRQKKPFYDNDWKSVYEFINKK